jgi:hypothetical protein
MKKTKKEVKKNNDNIGALWINKTNKATFMSGIIEDEEGKQTRIVVFKNKFKEKDNQPDYRILKARELEEKEDDEETTDELPF